MVGSFRVKGSKAVEGARELLDLSDVPVNLRLIDQIIPTFEFPHKMAAWAYDYVTCTGTDTFTFANIKVPEHEQWLLKRIIVENASPANGSFDEVIMRVVPEKILAVQMPPADMIVDLYNSSGVDYWSSSLHEVPAPAGSYFQVVADTHSTNFVVSIVLGFLRIGGAFP